MGRRRDQDSHHLALVREVLLEAFKTEVKVIIGDKSFDEK